MSTGKWINSLHGSFQIPPRLREPMKLHNSLKVGGPVDIFLQPNNLVELKEALLFIKKNNLPLVILGGGTNVLFSDKGFRGVALQLGPYFKKVTPQGNRLLVKGATPTPFLARKALKLSLTGLEFSWGIPGTVGGAVCMNAGAAGSSFSDIVDYVKLVNDEGEEESLSKKALAFDYRKSLFHKKKNAVIFECALSLLPGKKKEIEEEMKRLLFKRRQSQPSQPSAGSVFRNPLEAPAGLLIEKAGLKGYSIGDAQVSEVHANFIINRGNATATNVFELIKFVQERVREEFDLSLELEIKVLGEW